MIVYFELCRQYLFWNIEFDFTDLVDNEDGTGVIHFSAPPLQEILKHFWTAIPL